MGLDSVYLVMAYEESFGSSIPHEAASTMHRPRDVVRFFQQVLPKADAPFCLLQQGFYALRTALVGEWGVPRARVRPGTTWHELLPPRDARRAWDQLGRRLFGEPTREQRATLRSSPTVTVGTTVERLCVWHAAAMKRAGTGWSEHEIAWVVVELTKGELGVEAVPLDAHFVDDLGCN